MSADLKMIAQIIETIRGFLAESGVPLSAEQWDALRQVGQPTLEQVDLTARIFPGSVGCACHLDLGCVLHDSAVA